MQNSQLKKGLASLKGLSRIPEASSKIYDYDLDAIDAEVERDGINNPDRFKQAEKILQSLQNKSIDELYNLG